MTRPLRALIVDDSDDDRDLLLLTLRRAGFDVDWKHVATADALRAALANERWDVVLCDYHMPGFGALPALKLVQESGLDLPFIIASGVLGEEAAVSAMKAGAHDFFSKNRLARLGAAVERELADAQVRRARREAEAARDRMVDELRRALAARDEFLVLASHEFKTPLTIMRLQVDALAASRQALTDGARRQLDRLGRQTDRLAAMIERLLDATVLSSEPLRLIRAEVDLRQLVRDVVERSCDWIEQAECTVVLEPLDEAVGYWDGVRLDSVITNLLSNALKYGAGKPVTISLQRRPEAIRLSVRDQGIGIPAEQQGKLFQRFSRAVPVENYGGFGLGLWIVDQIVRAHGGTVAVSSSLGQGATFTVELPTGRA